MKTLLVLTAAITMAVLAGCNGEPDSEQGR